MVNEIAGWYNSFIIVQKTIKKLWLCLEPAMLNQALMQPIHRMPTFNDILLKLTNVQYMTISDASLAFHNLNLIKISHI